MGSMQWIMELMYGATLDRYQDLEYNGLDEEVRDFVRPYQNRPEVMDNSRAHLINKYREWIDGRAVSGNFAPVQAIKPPQSTDEQKPKSKRSIA